MVSKNWFVVSEFYPDEWQPCRRTVSVLGGGGGGLGSRGLLYLVQEWKSTAFAAHSSLN